MNFIENLIFNAFYLGYHQKAEKIYKYLCPAVPFPRISRPDALQ